MVRIGAIALSVLLTLTGCTAAASPTPPLNGTSWSVSAIAGTASLSGQRPTLAFADGRVSGSTGCNTLSGAYTQNGDGVTFSPLAVTQMACNDAAMAQETAVLAALPKVARARGDAAGVALLDASGTTLFTLAPPPPPPPSPTPLAATTWKLESFIEGSTTHSLLAGTSVTLTLNTVAGSYSGTACNTYGGDLSVSGATITFAVPHTTQKACAADALDQEHLIVSMLPKVRTWKIEGNALTLSAPQNALRFVAS